AFLLVYLIGFYNLDTTQALSQFGKGMVKFVIHFLFLGAAIAYLARRAERVCWRSLGWFCAGLVANSVYGVVQLLVARAGGNLDQRVLAPITGGASSINIYGAIQGASVYRPNALLAVAAVLTIVVLTRLSYFEQVLRSRIQTGGSSSSAHFDVYGFVPDVLHQHPLFGLGLNNFSVYYEFVTGKTNWGPHSFYVALLVETGLVGTLVFGLFLRYLFVRLRAARRLGRALATASDPLAARLRPLAWGLTATLAGTM